MNKWDSIHHAVVRKKIEEIKRLLEENPKRLNQPDQSNRSPLMLAVEYNIPTSFKLLLYYKPDLGIEDNMGYSALSLVASYGYIDMAQPLIDAGAQQTSKKFPDCAVAASLATKKYSTLMSMEDILGTYARKGYSANRANIHDIRKTMQFLPINAKKNNFPLCFIKK